MAPHNPNPDGITPARARALAWLAANEPTNMLPRAISMLMIHRMMKLGWVHACGMRGGLVIYQRTARGRELTKGGTPRC